MARNARTLADIDHDNGIIWRFDTARFTVAFWAEDEDLDPRDSFEFPEDIAFASTGDPSHWFCAAVGVFEADAIDPEDDSLSLLIAADYLGGCSYESFREFCGNRTGYRAGHKIVTGHYFPDMVRLAISEAKAALVRRTLVAEG